MYQFVIYIQTNTQESLFQSFLVFTFGSGFCLVCVWVFFIVVVVVFLFLLVFFVFV